MKNNLLSIVFSALSPVRREHSLRFNFFRLQLLAAFAAGNAGAAELSSMPDPTYVTNGPVQAVVRSGDTIYIGGRFDRVGPRTGPGVEVAALDGSQNPGLPEISGAGPSSFVGTGGGLNAVVADGSGGWYIGGLFTHVGGVACTNLAHIRADHSVDPNFKPSVNDTVRALAVSGSTIYVAGLFTSIGGQARNKIAAFNTADGSVKAFNPNANGTVEALAISNDGSIIYAGGRFSVIGGLPRLAIAALNAADGSATPTFDPNATGTGGAGNGVVNALAISGSTLYVGGSFNTIGGLPYNNIAALSLGAPLDGVAVPTFNPSPSRSGCAACGSVATLVVSGSTIYAGGLFDKIGGQPRKFLAGLKAADGTATAFDPSPNSNIFALAVSDSILYVSGGFNSPDGSPSIGGQARNYAAALNLADGTATGFNPNPNAVVTSVAVSGSAVYLGGYFSSLGGVVRRSIAAISATDGTATSWDPNARGFNGGTALVNALAVSGSTVYVGGYFGSIGGQPRVSIAAIDAPTGLATSWDASAKYGTGPAIIDTLAVGDSIIYAGGIFTSIGGQARSHIAALNPADATATTFNPNSNAEVRAVLLSGQLLYAAGFFTSIGGQLRGHVAALNIADGSATSWNPDVGPPLSNVLALAISGSTIYAGGNFATIQGVPRRNIGGINISDGTPTSFDPQANDPTTGGGVFALAVSGSTVYAAGFFSVIGGQPRNLLAGLNASDGSATSFDPNGAPGFGAFALAVASDGTLYAGGSFDTFDLAYQQGFAQFSPIVKLVSTVSRKVHGSAGTFDVDLPQTGTPGIECRTGGAGGNHQVVMTFVAPVTVTDATVTPGPEGTASIILAPGHQPPNEVVATLRTVSNAQTLTINLLGVSDGFNTRDVHIPMSILLGDVNANANVSNADVASVKAQVAAPVTSSNFRDDVNANGILSNGDVSITKAQVGTTLP